MEGVEVTIDSTACVGCGECQKVCFVDAIEIVDSKARITDQCRGCGRCIEVCPNHAVRIILPDTTAIENTIKRIHDNVDIK